MKYPVRITCQIFENKSEPTTPRWSPKGLQYMECQLDPTDVGMATDAFEQTITETLEDLSDEHTKYEYRAHEVIFAPVIQLDIEDRFNEIMSQNF